MTTLAAAAVIGTELHREPNPKELKQFAAAICMYHFRSPQTFLNTQIWSARDTCCYFGANSIPKSVCAKGKRHVGKHDSIKYLDVVKKKICHNLYFHPFNKLEIIKHHFSKY